MRFVVLLLAWGSGSVSPAFAGAWLQAEGSAFASLENTIRQRGDDTVLETDIFFEYGLRPRLSTGLTLLQEGGETGHIGLFLKTPLGQTDKPYVMSLQADIGGYFARQQWFGMTKLTLSYGRGFRWGDGYGWLNLDTAIEYRMGEPAPFLKLDGTIGRSSGARLRPMVEVSLTQTKGKPLIWSVSPNLLIDGKGKLTWKLGLERKNDGQSSNALNFGFWHRF